jgi:hypothetical protein
MLSLWFWTGLYSRFFAIFLNLRCYRKLLDVVIYRQKVQLTSSIMNLGGLLTF